MADPGGRAMGRGREHGKCRDRMMPVVSVCALLCVALVPATAASSSGDTSPASMALNVMPGGISLSGADGTPNLPFALDTIGDAGGETRESSDGSGKNGEWLIAPIPSRNPSVGWTVAVPVALLYRPSGVSADDPSWVTGIGGFYSENKSWGGGIFHKMNLDGDRWRMMGSLFYGDVNYDFYGIGIGNKNLFVPLNQDATGGLGEVLREVGGSVYAGVRVIGVGTNIRLVGRPGIVPPGGFGADLAAHFSLVTVAPRLLYDTRDNEFYPTSGDLAEAQVQISSTGLGSDLNYTLYELSWNHYEGLGEKGVVALRAAAKYASGDAPFFVYPSFGQGGDLRGYTPGTNRDRALVAVQAEYRLRVRESLGVVLFAGVGGVGPTFGGIDHALPSVGAGLRYVLAKENNISFRLDVARGRNESQFYVGIGEAF